MNKHNRIMSGAITGVLLVSLMGSPAIAFADNNYDNDRDDKISYSNLGYNKNHSARVYDQQKDKFSFIDGKHIQFNHKKVNFVVQPVIKEGRTLIPIRALEAMGAVVDWDEKTKVVTITKDDIRIFMNLVTDKVYVTESTTNYNEIVASDEMAVDVTPGIINNRTFVPLRFVAEIFGLKVDYDQGEISVVDQPRVIPTSVMYLTEDAIPTEAAIKVLDKDYTFDKIKGLTLGTDYRLNADTDFVYINDDYLKGLTNESNTLVFVFTKEGEEAVEVKCDVNLPYNATVTTVPTLDKSVLTYNDVDALSVTMALNEYALKGVTLDDAAFTTFTKSGEVVTFDKAYLDTLTENTTFYFVFEQEGKADVKVKLQINVVAETAVLPTLNKSVLTYNDVDALSVTMALNEYALKGVTLDNIAFTTYTKLGEVVTFDKAYLDTLTENTSFYFVFEKEDEADVKVKLQINVDSEAAELPTLNKSEIVYNDINDALITMDLNEYTFKAISVDDEAFTNFSKVGNIFILDNLYLDTLSADTTFNFIFSHTGSEDVTIPVEVKVL